MVEKKINAAKKKTTAAKASKGVQSGKTKSQSKKQNIKVFKSSRYDSKNLNNYRDFLRCLLGGDEEGGLEEV